MSSSNNNPHGLYVGQVLYYAPYDRRHSIRECSVTVEKIGRKWVEISPHWVGRIDIQTLRVDGGNYTSPGQCWLSEEAYKQKAAADAAWSAMRNALHGGRPENCTAEHIKNAAKALGLAWGE
jgi:hypothetical protein